MDSTKTECEVLYIYFVGLFVGDTVMQWLALTPHSKKVAGLIPVSVWVFSRFSSFLTRSKTCKSGQLGSLNFP